MTTQIQKIREVCSAVIEAEEANDISKHKHISDWSEAGVKHAELAANHSSQLAKSLLIAVEALERFRGEEKFYSRIEANDPVFHFPADEALEQITSQLTGEE